jgi:exodeoxyribonuclease V beta subunit
LVAGKGHQADAWGEGDTTFEHIEACWAALKQQAAGSIDLMPLPNDKRQPHLDSATQATQYAARTLSKKIPGISWRLDSYSGLLRQQAGEYAAIDHDAVSLAPTFSSRPAPGVPDNDILRFSRGALAGECVHTVFEKADFTRPDRWPVAIDKALRRHFGVAALPEAGRLQTMLGDVLNTPLPGGWMLKDVSPQRRFAEFDFFFSVDCVKATALFDLLEQHGWNGKRIGFGTLNGFMRGSIDFICEHAGRWYLIDWKSNYLGGSPDAYSPERITDTMHEASYDLQAIIYLVALHRYLRSRLGNQYNAKNNLGGALYLFIRGVRPSWPGKGIWHWQPPPVLIEELDAMFSNQYNRSAA